MEVVATATATSFHRRTFSAPLLPPHSSPRTKIPLSTKALCTSSLPKPSLSSCFLSPVPCTSYLTSDFFISKIRPECINPAPISISKRKRSVVTMVIPWSGSNAREQPPPDLASYLFDNRIVYLGMSLVPAVTELLLAQFLYLQFDDDQKPIYFYINSTGTTKGDEKLSYDTEAFAIYDVMRYVKPPVFTLCVGNAWGEAALLLAAGARGNRAALPSSTIMIKEPIGRFQGQATDVDLARKFTTGIKADLVECLAENVGKTKEEIEADIRQPKYFSPSEAVEYGIIDKVLYNEKSSEDRGVVADLKKRQLI